MADAGVKRTVPRFQSVEHVLILCILSGPRRGQKIVLRTSLGNSLRRYPMSAFAGLAPQVCAMFVIIAPTRRLRG